ncbi:hypothetical protein KI688_008748 [Linnemannia hyalina]|uniref:CoA-binding domain-containing protein n=1 Tax=Linnemannia hyalina TaxID=64524 RepID=A0A9P7Y3M6_9FUNG|nr:hypothetical protein KI688_008748 [Linnemannia hyalina]
MASQAATALFIREFFSSAEQKFAVVGASTNRSKFGNKVLRCLSSLPGTLSDYHVSIITPPTVTKSILEEAHKNGIRRVWLQPGVESDAALEFAKEKGMQVIAGGPCVLENGIPAAQL